MTKNTNKANNTTPMYGPALLPLQPEVIRIQDIIDKVKAIRSDADTTLLQRAYVFSASRHAGQVRLSGEPYLSHPLAVAYILADMRMDEATIAAGLLHDTVEDTEATVEEISALFGKNVADIVDGGDPQVQQQPGGCRIEGILQ